MPKYGRFTFFVVMIVAACAGAQLARERASYTVEASTLPAR